MKTLSGQRHESRGEIRQGETVGGGYPVATRLLEWNGFAPNNPGASDPGAGNSLPSGLVPAINAIVAENDAEDEQARHRAQEQAHRAAEKEAERREAERRAAPRATAGYD